MWFVTPFCLYALFIISAITAASSSDTFSTRDFITAKTFQQGILDSSEVFLVFFFKTAEDVRDELLYNLSDKLLNYGIKIAYIDCSNKLNKNICPTMNVPSLQMYTDKPESNPYTGKNYRKPIPFTGGSPKTEDIERFVNRKYPNQVLKAKNIEDLHRFMEPPESSAGKSVNTTTVLLFSVKDTVPMFFKNIAYKFKNQLKFIQISPKNAIDYASHYTTKSPSLVVMTQQSTDASPTAVGTVGYEYPSSLTDRDAIITWLNQYLPTTTSDSNGNDVNNSGNGSSGDKWKTVDESLQIESLDPSSAYVIGVFPTVTTTTATPVDSASDETANTAATVVTTTAVNGNTEYELWKNMSMLCEGNVNAILLKCSSDNSTYTKENKQQTSTFGESLCSYNINTNSGSTATTPYIYILKYSTTARTNKIDTKNIFKLSPTTITDVKEITYDSLPQSHVKHLISEQAFHQFVQENHQTQTLTIAILSKKQTVSYMIHNIALSISKIKSVENPNQSIAKVGFLSDLSPDFLKNLGNPKVPGMIAMSLILPLADDPEAVKNGLQARVINYDPAMYGPIRHETALHFTRGVYSGAGLGTAQPESGSATAHSSSSGVQIVSELTTPTHWSTHCSETFRGICAIALFSSSSDDSSGGSGDSAKSSFQAAAVKITSTTSNSHSLSHSTLSPAATYRFMSLDNTDTCHQSFMESFNLNSLSLPAVVAYSAAKGRYAVFKGTFSETEIKSFFDLVLSGGQSTVPLSSRPVFSESCENNGNSGDSSAVGGSGDIVEELEDASDLLEEIRREEAEANKQRKLEMEHEIKERLLLQEQEQNSDKNGGGSDKSGKKKTVKRVVKKKKSSSSKKSKSDKSEL